MTANEGRLVKMETEKLRRGRPYDEFRCFYIKDFQEGDCIRVKGDSDEKIRGIVTSVDLDQLHIVFKTTSSDTNRVTIDKILTLEPYRRGWLEE
tara:strand:+ start:4182 stop:4463 length:282 start_codon:yes stop_codon:yes gene_type:complete